MIEKKKSGYWLSHLGLCLGVLFIFFPVWLAFVGSTVTQDDILQPPYPVLPGPHFFENYSNALFHGGPDGYDVAQISVLKMLINSTIMALGITIGKIIISLLSAFAFVYFRFPGRKTFFWIIFLTLMLPIEVRIVPTYQVAANLGLLNSYTGLIFPLIASATATFLFRQFFLTVPSEMVEAARIDGATPMQFFKDILIPISKTNIAALFVILFVYGFNQYLWPLLITTTPDMQTIVMGIKFMIPTGDDYGHWPTIFSTAMLAMLPPVLIVIGMQKFFVKGLLESDK
ncbi:sn-glycerol-3-phosphate ABC transporter permease UgpE [Pelagibacteraceae bacterium]|jgi:sn-glycerol 3-phosphate transport system permease protein|nr:sn-glycerol-3-phosphate ABC transporter permease UgpE [Pelagibacteraceae bacterium]